MLERVQIPQVATVWGRTPAAELADALFDRWSVGDRARCRNGILLLIAVEDNHHQPIRPHLHVGSFLLSNYELKRILF